MFASRTESRQLYYTGKQVQHDGSHIGDAHNGCPNPGVRIAFATYWFLIIMTIKNYNYTSNRSHQNGPQENGLKSWWGGSLAMLRVRTSRLRPCHHHYHHSFTSLYVLHHGLDGFLQMPLLNASCLCRTGDMA